MCICVRNGKTMSLAALVAVMAGVAVAVYAPQKARAEDPDGGTKAPAQQAPSTPPGPGGAREGRGEGRGAARGGEPVDVERSMKGMQRTLKSLRGTIGDAAKKDDNLRMINELQRAAVGCKLAGAPANILAHGKTDADKAKMTEAYRTHLIAVVREMLNLEEQIAGGKTQEATATLDKIMKTRDEAHKAMGVD